MLSEVMEKGITCAQFGLDVQPAARVEGLVVARHLALFYDDAAVGRRRLRQHLLVAVVGLPPHAARFFRRVLGVVPPSVAHRRVSIGLPPHAARVLRRVVGVVPLSVAQRRVKFVEVGDARHQLPRALVEFAQRHLHAVVVLLELGVVGAVAVVEAGDGVGDVVCDRRDDLILDPDRGVQQLARLLALLRLRLRPCGVGIFEQLVGPLVVGCRTAFRCVRVLIELGRAVLCY